MVSPGSQDLGLFFALYFVQILHLYTIMTSLCTKYVQKYFSTIL